MYEIFGIFDSAEEINNAAVGLKNEGDLDNVYVLAKENGINDEYADAFIAGDIPFLTDVFNAAVGRIEVERNGKINSSFKHMKDDVINYILTQCDNEEFAKQIRKKNKSLEKCFDYILKGVKKILGNESGAVRDKEVYELAKKYYMEGEIVE